MSVPILIVTSDASFGELIRQTLDEVSGYWPVLALSAEQAAGIASRTPFALAILDADLNKSTLVNLWQTMRLSAPAPRLVIISPGDGLLDLAGAAAFGELQVDGMLSKPFYLPDLLKMVGDLLGGTEFDQEEGSLPVASSDHFNVTSIQAPKAGDREQMTPPLSELPPWLEDVTRAAQHLTRLSLEADAQAALITRADALWAYAGQLPQPAAIELAQVVLQDWAHDARQSGSDLARFVRLESTGGEYMLYATGLGDAMVLALAFDAATPFSKIRAQAGSLARALASPPRADEAILTAENASIPPRPVEQDMPELVDWEVLDSDLPVTPLFPLDSVPPPTPPGILNPLNNHDFSSGSFSPGDAADLDQKPSFGSLFPGVDGEQPYPDTSEKFTPGYWSPAVSSFPGRQENLTGENIEDLPVDEAPTVPLRLPVQVSPNFNLEPATPTLYSLNYACVLIPRLSQHHLVGGLTGRLAEWVRQLCLSFGWRLEHLAVRPDYLLWISNVPPNTSPGHMVKMMRYHTSQRIFTEFPQFTAENPSGDFWALGYLVVAASQPPPSQVMKDFVDRTRRQQGGVAGR